MDPEREQVLEAFRGYVRTSGEAANQGDPDYPGLLEYAEGVVVVQVRAAIRRHAENGRIYSGREEVVSAEVTDLNMDATPPTASVVACIDASEYRLVYEEDGSPVPVDRQVGRYVSTATLSFAGDRWLVSEDEAAWDAPC
jgi:hypothetical protein